MKQLVRLAEVEEGSLVPVRVDHLDLLVGVADGRYFAIEDLCPHAWVPFGRAKLDGRRLTCPWHGLVFDVLSGECETWPELEEVRRFPVRAENGMLLLDD